MKDIQESWAAIQFTVARHFNRGEDRGYTLNPCDEITVKVDEDAMSLQSMAASQYVTIYLFFSSFVYTLLISILQAACHSCYLWKILKEA